MSDVVGVDPEKLIISWETVLVSVSGPLTDSHTFPGLAATLAELTVRGLAGPQAAAEAGVDIGRLLVRHQLTTPAAVQAAVGLLANPAHSGAGSPLGEAEPACRALLAGAAAASHSEEVQRLLLRQQESIHRATIAAREGAERALRESEARFKALFMEAGVGIGVGDVKGRILDLNPAFHRMLGYSRDELLSRRVEEFTHPDDVEGTWDEYAALVAGEIDACRMEKPYQHKAGHVVWTNLTLSLVRDEQGSPLFHVAIMEDVTERHRLQAELLHAATHDPLTGLPNRTLFLERLKAAADAGTTGVAVLFLDLDGFKFVNDSRGHLVGDEVLVTVARRFQSVADEHGALVARLAGDEFVMLLHSDDDLAADLLAQRLQSALQEPIDVEGQQPVNVRASVGLVKMSSPAADPGELMRAADLALHAAKENGPGQIVLHDPSRTARQLSRFTLGTHLHGLAERDELRVVYQPLITLATGQLHSMEALLRWSHPVLGEVLPDQFIPIAEETSAIVPIGQWVLEQACADMARSAWPAVNINVSVRQLYTPALVTSVQRFLDRSGLDAGRLRIEVTESVLMHSDDPAAVQTLRSLAKLGTKIVLDDFGTGYSNLGALRRLPLSELKLAAVLLSGSRRDGGVDDVGTEMLAAVVSIGHSVGLVVTAEGVETKAQHEVIRQLGVDVGQGRFYGSPAPVEFLAEPRPPDRPTPPDRPRPGGHVATATAQAPPSRGQP